MIYVGGGNGAELRYRACANVFGANMLCSEKVKVLVLPENIKNSEDFRVVNTLSEFFRDDGTVPDEDIKGMIEDSFDLTKPKAIKC